MRSIYLAPIGVSLLAVISFAVSLVHSPNIATPLAAAQPYMMASLLIMATTFIVALYYCIDALYGERRDRSILFWKSLPVSDVTTVLAKATVPIVILPLVTFLATVATHLAMMLIHSIALLANGGDVSMLNAVGVPSFWAGLFHHLFAIHGLWFAPFYGWLLLVSAWSRRAPLVWALLPPIVVGVLEKMALDTSYFRSIIRNRVLGGSDADAFMTSGANDPIGHIHFSRFLLDPGLWWGLLFTALCLFAAARLRRPRGPSS